MVIASSRFACHDRLYFACEIPANVRFCHRISHQQGEIVPWWQGQHVCLIFCQNEIRRCGGVLLGLVLKKSSLSTLKKSWKRCSIRIGLATGSWSFSPEMQFARGNHSHTYHSSSKPRNSVFSWPRQKDTTFGCGYWWLMTPLIQESFHIKKIIQWHFNVGQLFDFVAALRFRHVAGWGSGEDEWGFSRLFQD